MKKIALITIFIAVCLIICIIYHQIHINEFCENTKKLYGDDIRIVSVNRDFKTNEYYAIATYPPDNTTFNVYSDGYNSYLHDYWTKYMQDEANKAIKNLFNNKGYCSKIILYSGVTKLSPANGTMTYLDYLDKYADVSQTYVIYKNEGRYSESYSNDFHKLFINLSKTNLKYGHVTIFFEDCSFRITFENVMKLSENYKYEAIRSQKSIYGTKSFD